MTATAQELAERLVALARDRVARCRGDLASSAAGDRAALVQAAQLVREDHALRQSEWTVEHVAFVLFTATYADGNRVALTDARLPCRTSARHWGWWRERQSDRDAEYGLAWCRAACSMLCKHRYLRSSRWPWTRTSSSGGCTGCADQATLVASSVRPEAASHGPARGGQRVRRCTMADDSAVREHY